MAVLLTGDWHAAEDLVQASLVKLYRAWPRLDTNADPDAYLRRIMVNTHRSWWRARWRRETPTEVLSETGLKGIGPVTLNGEFDPARGVGEETSGTGSQVRFAGGYMYLPLSDAFRAAFEKNRGISIPAGKSWVRFPAPLRSGGEVTLINLTQFGIAPSDLGQVSPLGLLGLLQSMSQVRQTGPASGHGWTGTAYSFTFTKDFGGSLHLVLRVKGTVGVDREGRVRQLDADYSIGKTRQRSEMTFGDFGAPVSVSAPPTGEVYIPHPAG